MTNVDSGSAAEDAGIERGDVILEINRKPISNLSDFRRATASVSGPALLLINRGGNTLYIVVNF